MNSSIDAEGTMNREEEQLWFRSGTILLIVFFVLCGGGLAWSQWRIKRADDFGNSGRVNVFAIPVRHLRRASPFETLGSDVIQGHARWISRSQSRIDPRGRIVEQLSQLFCSRYR